MYANHQQNDNANTNKASNPNSNPQSNFHSGMNSLNTSIVNVDEEKIAKMEEEFGYP